MGGKAKSEADAIFWFARLNRVLGEDSPVLRVGLTIAIVTASIVIALITS
jgi:hypothetical protein